jgi:two-component system, OmpR family, phosphate regulon sensor histidine kinase PhoR
MIIFILLIGLSIVTSGLFMARMLKNSHLEALRQQMKREIGIIVATLDWSKLQGPDRLDYFSRYARILKTGAEARVTFIGKDGRVLGDSDHDAEAMDNHFDRQEIAEARERGEGYAIRYSDTILQNMMYVALPVESGELGGYIRLALSLGDIEAAVRKLWSTLAAGAAIFFLLAAGVSYRISHSLTRPLERIMKTARLITNQQYDARVKVDSWDEIGQLGRAINRMADSLKHQLDTIRENEGRLQSVLGNMISGVLMIDRSGVLVLVNRSAENYLGFTSEELIGKHYQETRQPLELLEAISICLERQERIREEMVFYFPEERVLEVSLIPMTIAGGWHSGVVIVLHDITAIRRLERMRSEFVSNVSHELKTPIAAVKGFAETLMAGAINDPDTARSFLQIIYDESERLNRLIGDILELSKIESRRIPLQLSPVHVRACLAHSLEVMGPEAEAKSIELLMEVPDDLFVEADEDRLHQIVINLVSNGIHYTLEGGRIYVSAEPAWNQEEHGDYEFVRIKVSDTGIGIPKKDLPRIFERFYRVDKARSRNSGGTGLGLSIVKHLVEMHKGSIRAESELGLGTTFTIELPVIQG